MSSTWPWLTLILTCLANAQKQFVVKTEKQTESKPKLQSLFDLETTALEYTINIDTHYAVTTVLSRFWNADFVNSEEAEFSVELPDGAYITEFRMIVADEIYTGVVLEKEQAGQVYDDAVQAGQNAGLVSEESDNVFTIAANVAPLTSTTFELTYEQLLERRLGWYEYDLHIPADDDTIVECHGHYDCSKDKYCDLFKKCYECLSCPIFYDAIDFWCPPCMPEVIIEPLQPRGSVSVRILVTEEDGFQNYEAPLPVNPEARIDEITSKSLEVLYPPEAESVPLGQPIALTFRYQINPPQNEAGSLITDTDREYFVHLFSPPELGTFNKAMIFVLDRSGSMSGIKFEQLQQVVVLIIDSLSEFDYMNFVFFNNMVESWQPQLLPATETNKVYAKDYVNSQTAGGTTAINDALLLGITLLKESQLSVEYAPQLIFLTDGMANVGETSSEGIRSNVRAANDQLFSIYSLGLGDNLDYELLRGIALENYGFDRRIGEDEDVTVAVELFYGEIDSTVLSDIEMLYTIDHSDCCVAEHVTQNIYPRLFVNSEIIVAGFLPDDATLVIATARGTLADGSEKTFSAQFDVSASVAAAQDRGSVVPVRQIWAFMTLQDILEEIEVLSGLTGNDEELQQLQAKALDLSLEYGFVTDYTSLVVVPDICEFAADVEGCASEFSIPTFLRDPITDADLEGYDTLFTSGGLASASNGASASGGAGVGGAFTTNGAKGPQISSQASYGYESFTDDHVAVKPGSGPNVCTGDLYIEGITRSCLSVHVRLCNSASVSATFTVTSADSDTAQTNPLRITISGNDCSKDAIFPCGIGRKCDFEMDTEIKVDVLDEICEEDEGNNIVTKTFGEQVDICSGVQDVQQPDVEGLGHEEDSDQSHDDSGQPDVDAAYQFSEYESQLSLHEDDDEASPPTTSTNVSVPVPVPAPAQADTDGVCRHEHGAYNGPGVLETVSTFTTPGNCCAECLKMKLCGKWQYLPSDAISGSAPICVLRRDGNPVEDDFWVRKVENVL